MSTGTRHLKPSRPMRPGIQRRLGGNRVDPERGIVVWALVAVLIVVAAGLIIATRTSFFYADDYLNMWLGRTNGLTIALLKISVFGEFAPGHRLLDWLMGAHLGLNWTAALVICMVVWAGAVAAFHWVARQLLPSKWLVLITAAVFASSPVWVRAIQWWANAEHVVPATCGMLLALGASLAWLRGRDWRALLLAVVSEAAALAFYAKPSLLLLYVILLAYFVPSRVTRERPLRRQLLDDLPLLGALAAVTVGYAALVHFGGYTESSPNSPDFQSWLTYLRVDWFQGLTPFVIGQSSIPNHAGVAPVIDWLAQAALIALVVASLVRSRLAWRAWAFYLIVWLVNAVFVGLGRLGVYGPGLAFDPRYNAEFSFLLPLAVGLAFSAPRVQPASAVSATGRGRPAALAVAFGVGTAVAFGVSLGISYARISSAWPAGQGRTWVNNVRSSVTALRARGIQPSVIDALVPPALMPGAYPPAYLVSNVLPELRDGIVLDDQTGHDPPAVVLPNGTVSLAVARTLAGGTASTLVRSRELAVQKPGTGLIRGGAFCASAGASPVLIPFQPSAPVTLPAHNTVLQVSLAPGSARGVLFVYLDEGQGYPLGPSQIVGIRSSSVVLRFSLIASRFVKARMDLQADSTACIRSAAVVTYSAASRMPG